MSLNKENRQADRRLKLLHEQKKQRSDLIDEIRGIEQFREYFQRRPVHNKKEPRINIYKNHTQLSEWLLERPPDFADWYLCPCPKGTRCLVVATDGRTEVYYKSGAFMTCFHSNLPGGFRTRQSITILDCIFIPSSSEYYVLDVLSYGTQDMTNCEAVFRFFWLDSRLTEENLDKVTFKHHFAFKSIPKYDCADEYTVRNVFNRYPMWEHNYPELDGFLFYHKESSYIYGKTPLVGWLYAYMVPEVLHLPVNDAYMNERPDGYTDYLSFIKNFSTRKKENNKNDAVAKMVSMETENCDDSIKNENVDQSVEMEAELEEEGQHTGEIDDYITAEIEEKLNKNNGEYTR